MSFSSLALEVDRRDTTRSRVVTDELGPLADGMVRLRVDRFAITANTVTYAEVGEILGYWGFYPTADEAWGRVPAMGWADLIESRHPDIDSGARYYGWFPMADFVDLTVSTTDNGLRDDGVHRREHAPVYRALVASHKDPLYPADVNDPAMLTDLEDRHALLRGLFLTGFLADRFFDTNEWFGADTVVVLSASSKTAIAFADCAARRDLTLVGVTSEANIDFVRRLGIYSDVISYPAIGSAAISSQGAVAIDMAGNGAAMCALHDHLGGRLAYSMVVGRTHTDAPAATVTSGPTPQMFFAPTALGELSRRGVDVEAVLGESSVALHDFVNRSIAWLEVERGAGPEATAATWADVRAGRVAPSIGRITSMHG